MHPPIDLPSGLSARPVRRADLPAVHRIVATYEQQLLGEPLIELEDLEVDWQRPSFDAERDSVLVLDEADVVAWGALQGARRATASVHPDAWGRGIGSALVDWCSRLVREQGGATVGQTVPDADAAAAALFSSRGWSPLWTSWVLELPPGASIPPRDLPSGYALRTSRPDQDARAIYEVIEVAFGEWPNREPTAFGDWAANVVERPGFEPWQLLLAVRDEHVVGACYVTVSGASGWIQQLAVDRAHRGRGIAQALLSAAFSTARDRGARRCELSTDSRTGALALYQRLGMRVRWSFTHWAVEPR